MTDFTRENTALFDQLTNLLYYSRGSLSRDDVLAMAPIERDNMVDFLNKRMEEVSELVKKGITPFW